MSPVPAPAFAPLLAAGDPFEHTWNVWGLDLYTHILRFDAIPWMKGLGITNAVATMLFVAVLLIVVCGRAGAEARRAAAENRAPRGMAAAIESMVEFVRDQVLRPNMPHHYRNPGFLALFCTLFFFILSCNLLGLLPQPFGRTATGSPWINAGLAFGVTFCVGILGAGIREKGPLGFFKGLVPHGVPLLLWPLLFAIELVGLCVKPFALMIRLTANMTAGHIILAVLASFLTMGISSVGTFVATAASAFGYFAITVFEIAIAFIQAYIFTVLSSVFVGQSLSHEH